MELILYLMHRITVFKFAADLIMSVNFSEYGN